MSGKSKSEGKFKKDKKEPQQTTSLYNKQSKDKQKPHAQDSSDQQESEEQDYDQSSSSINQTQSRDCEQMSPWTFDSLPPDLEKKVLEIAGLIQVKANQVRKKEPVDWQSYLQGGQIDEMDYEFINSFQFAPSKIERDNLIRHFKEKAFQAFHKIIQVLDKKEHIRKFLVLFYDLLLEDPSWGAVFHQYVPEPWKPYLQRLEKRNSFERYMCSRIIARLMTSEHVEVNKEDQEQYLRFLKNELHADNRYMQSVVRCLQKMLRLDSHRKAFMNLSGVLRILEVLMDGVIPQLQYQLCFCLWLTSFNPSLAEKMYESVLVPLLMDLLTSCPRENIKLPRIIFAIFRYLLERPKSNRVKRHTAFLLLKCKIQHIMDLLESDQRTQSNLQKDAEFMEDYKALQNLLEQHTNKLTSFEEYSVEIQNGLLEWSLVHTSKRFWVDNAHRLNDNDYELLKLLIGHLQKDSQEVVALCVAAHDLGEYMRHYRRGRKLVDQMGGKDAMLKLLEHKNARVRYSCLKTLQILMLTNYSIQQDEENSEKYGRQ